MVRPERVDKAYSRWLDWGSIPGSSREEGYYLLTNVEDIEALFSYLVELEGQLSQVDDLLIWQKTHLKRR